MTRLSTMTDEQLIDGLVALGLREMNANDALVAALTKARSLHEGEWCATCDVASPCPTFAALDPVPAPPRKPRRKRAASAKTSAVKG